VQRFATRAVLAWALALLAARGAAAAPAEYAVKAAFLYNFSKFVEWPAGAFASPADPIRICVVGENPFGGLLAEAVRDKQVNGRSFTVQETSTIAEAATCQIVFLAASEERRFDELLRQLGARPILTVGDANSIAARGGIIGLTVEDSKVHFEVNLPAARQAGLKLSSQLLKVATRLIGQLEQEP
jgi:uncharacterized protein DUF4154